MKDPRWARWKLTINGCFIGWYKKWYGGRDSVSWACRRYARSSGNTIKVVVCKKIWSP